MTHTTLWRFALTCLLGLSCAAPAAHAQFQLAEQESASTTTVIIPADPTVLATTRSPEIMAVDVAPMHSSGYVLFTGGAIWIVTNTANTPLRAQLLLRLDFSSPALPPGMHLAAAVPLTTFGTTNNASDTGFRGGSANATAVLTRQTFADFLQQANGISADVASQMADGFFDQGFHVSVSGQLTSRNISAANITNPGVAFFAQAGSIRDF